MPGNRLIFAAVLLIGLPAAVASEHHTGATAATPAPLPSASIELPSKIRNPPRYPREAVDAGADGLVVVLVNVGSDGVPRAIRIDRSSGHAALDQAALDAAARWTYQPAIIDGKTAPGEVRIPVKFSLD